MGAQISVTQKITTQPLGCLSLFHSDQSFVRTINLRQSNFRCLALGSLSGCHGACPGTAQQPDFQPCSSAPTYCTMYATFNKSRYLLWASVPSLENKLAVNVSWGFFLSLGLGDIENCHVNTVRRYSEGEG